MIENLGWPLIKKENEMSDLLPMECAINPLSLEDSIYLERNFTYHSPKGDQAIRYGLLRDKAKSLAELIFRLCPPSEDRIAALRILRESIMTANAAIACNE